MIYYTVYAEDNARFFTDTLPGMNAPLGSPGGATKLGPVPADTPLVANLPPHLSASGDQQEAPR